MRIELIVVGKTSDKNIVEAISDYVGRISHYAQFDVRVVEGLKNTRNMTREQQRRQEGERIMRSLSPTDTVVLLDERGSERRSVEFAAWLEKKQIAARKLVFVIGGAFGFSKEIYERADEQMSLSRMTLSHQMVRLLFVEQLYRAFTILKGESYHHE